MMALELSEDSNGFATDARLRLSGDLNRRGRVGCESSDWSLDSSWRFHWHLERSSPMGIARLAQASTKGGGAGRFDVTSIVNSNLIVTPAVTASGTLKLITWKFDNTGALTRLGDSGDLGGTGQVTGVATPPISIPADLCTVFRQASGELGLLVWRLDPGNGSFTIEGSGVSEGPGNSLTAEATGETLVSVWRDDLGNLRLKSRSVHTSSTLGSGKAGAVSSLGHPVLANVLVTPVIVDCTDVMKLIVWQLDKNGSLARIGDSGNAGGKASRVALAQIGGKWATAARAGDDWMSTSGGLGGLANGMLRISFWERANGSLHRAAEKLTSIPIVDVDAAGLDYSESGLGGLKEHYRIVTAVRAANGKLRLMVWSWLPQEAKINLDADSGDQAEPISYLRLHSLGNDLYMTMVRDDTPDKDGKPLHRLKLITWRIQ
jgi:hypothetical protein